MTRDRIEHHILWHCLLLSSSEHAFLIESDDGYQLQAIPGPVGAREVGTLPYAL